MCVHESGIVCQGRRGREKEKRSFPLDVDIMCVHMSFEWNNELTTLSAGLLSPSPLRVRALRRRKVGGEVEK